MGTGRSGKKMKIHACPYSFNLLEHSNHNKKIGVGYTFFSNTRVGLLYTHTRESPLLNATEILYIYDTTKRFVGKGKAIMSTMWNLALSTNSHKKLP